MNIVYELMSLYAAVGIVMTIRYWPQIKMHIGLMESVARYDSPDDMSEDQLRLLLLTIYMVMMVLAWPAMVPTLESLR